MITKLLQGFKKAIKPKDDKQYLHLKDEVSVLDLLYMHPHLLVMLSYVNAWCNRYDVKCVVSSIYRPPNDGVSVSKTHQQYRAFDLSLKPYWGWNDRLIKRLEKDVLEAFGGVGAISGETGETRPVYLHGEGENFHAHFQVRPIPTKLFKLSWLSESETRYFN